MNPKNETDNKGSNITCGYIRYSLAKQQDNSTNINI